VAFGVWGAVTGVSTALGPVLGGVITTNWSWRGIFLVNVPIGVLAVVLTAWRVQESKSPRPTPPDWIGFVLLTTGLVSLVYGLIRAGENSFSDTGVIACLAVGAGALAAFIVAERRVAYPMFDLSLLRVPTFAGASIAAFAMNGSLYAVLLWLVLYLQDILGYSAQDAGLRLAIISGAQFVTATIAGRSSERVPARWLIGPGLLLVGVGLIIMAGLTGGSGWTDLIPGFIVSGLGSGLVNPPLASTAIGVVPPQKAGMASGVNATFRQVGIAAGIAGLGVIFNSALQHSLTGAAAVASSAPRIVAMVRQGQVGQLLASLPPARRGEVAAAIKAAFAAGLNDLLYVTAAVALVGAVCALLLIRSKDFVSRTEPQAAPAGDTGSGTGSVSQVRSDPVGLFMTRWAASGVLVVTASMIFVRSASSSLVPGRRIGLSCRCRRSRGRRCRLRPPGSPGERSGRGRWRSGPVTSWAVGVRMRRSPWRTGRGGSRGSPRRSWRW
jgi:predicted MFS family arabinose efflux permease